MPTPPDAHLLRWLRRQLAQPGPLREHLEAAVANDDPAELRRVIGAMDDLSGAQRRQLLDLVDRWEGACRATGYRTADA